MSNEVQVKIPNFSLVAIRAPTLRDVKQLNKRLSTISQYLSGSLENAIQEFPLANYAYDGWEQESPDRNFDDDVYGKSHKLPLIFFLREKLLFAVNTNILISYFGETWPTFIRDLEIPRIRCTGTGKYRIKLPALNRDGLEPSLLVDNMNSGLQRKVSLILVCFFFSLWFIDPKYAAFSSQKWRRW